MRYPFASEIIKEVAPTLDITLELEPEFGFVGELIFPNGKRHLFRNTNFNINPAGSVEIAKDKGYTKYVLAKHGFKVPKGQTFFSEKLNKNLAAPKRRGITEAISYAESIGFPVFVKPNNLSQGEMVCKVSDARQLKEVFDLIFSTTKAGVLIVEEACKGLDYRVVVLGETIISAYERRPLTVTGNSRSTIQELLQLAKGNLNGQGRPNAEIQIEDFRIDYKLKEQGLNRNSILLNGASSVLLDNANLSTGGTSVDVTDLIHMSFKGLAFQATKTLGLNFSGVDFLCADLSHDASLQDWTIIEVNGAPGLDNYASLGQSQMERVKSLYTEILRYLQGDNNNV